MRNALKVESIENTVFYGFAEVEARGVEPVERLLKISESETNQKKQQENTKLICFLALEKEMVIRIDGGMEEKIGLLAILAFSLTFAVIGMLAAGTKGNRSAGFWWGLFLGPLGVLIAMLMPENPEGMMRRCPYCKASLPKHKAQRCNSCGGMLARKRQNPNTRILDPVDQWEAKNRSGNNFK